MNSIEVKDIETSIEPKNECYICCEPGAPKSCCDCKNIFLHSKCQLKMVTELNDCTCRICKKDYKNIIVVKEKKQKLTQFGAKFFSISIINCIIIPSDIYFLNEIINGNDVSWLYTVFVYFFSTIFLFSFIYELYLNIMIYSYNCKIFIVNVKTLIELKKNYKYEY